MTRLSGASSAARLAHAILLQLHKTEPGDLDDSSFPAPPGRVAVELCGFWRQAQSRCAGARVALKALVEPRAAQIVWYVDGEPFAVSDPDKPLFWPLQKGAHQFQVRLPLRRRASKIVRIVVE